jgi:hypothetical protein
MGRDTHEQRLAPTVLALALACGPSPDAPDDARSADASAAIRCRDRAGRRAIADALAPDADPTIVDPALPLIHDHSGAPRAHVLDLVRRALDGLGFDPASGEVTSPTGRTRPTGAAARRRPCSPWRSTTTRGQRRGGHPRSTTPRVVRDARPGGRERGRLPLTCGWVSVGGPSERPSGSSGASSAPAPSGVRSGRCVSRSL